MSAPYCRLCGELGPVNDDRACDDCAAQATIDALRAGYHKLRARNDRLEQVIAELADAVESGWPPDHEERSTVECAQMGVAALTKANEGLGDALKRIADLTGPVDPMDQRPVADIALDRITAIVHGRREVLFGHVSALGPGLIPGADDGSPAYDGRAVQALLDRHGYPLSDLGPVVRVMRLLGIQGVDLAGDEGGRDV